jgi:hypothetical protein
VLPGHALCPLDQPEGGERPAQLLGQQSLVEKDRRRFGGRVIDDFEAAEYWSKPLSTMPSSSRQVARPIRLMPSVRGLPCLSSFLYSFACALIYWVRLISWTA